MHSEWFCATKIALYCMQWAIAPFVRCAMLPGMLNMSSAMLSGIDERYIGMQRQLILSLWFKSTTASVTEILHQQYLCAQHSCMSTYRVHGVVSIILNILLGTQCKCTKLHHAACGSPVPANHHPLCSWVAWNFHIQPVRQQMVSLSQIVIENSCLWTF